MLPKLFPFALTHLLDDLATEQSMLLHSLEFFRCQLTWFQQDLIWNADLADVMQLSRLFQHADRGRIQSEGFADDAGVPAHLFNVPAGMVVAIFHCASQAMNDVQP